MIDFNFKKYVKTHQFELFLYNIFIMFLVLMHSLGYFDPYFLISANIVVNLSILLAALILHIKSNLVFFLSVFFLLVSMFFKLLEIDVWSERVSMYAYEALLIGVALLLWENLDLGDFKNKINSIRIIAVSNKRKPSLK